jgi:sugar O-acyltransferase (sialic acid O-acetyltransferase NeuD family)
MKKLAIIGSGDLGQQIAHHALIDRHYKPIGFFDDWAKKGDIKHSLPVLGKTENVHHAFEEGLFDVLMIGIGYKHIQKRKELFELFKGKIPFANIIHSSCYVDESVEYGEGNFIYPGCVLDMKVKLRDNIILNVGCTIAHDTAIDKHCIFAPAVKVAGFVEIGECVNLGIGTVVIDNLKISPYIKSGAGAIVTKNLDIAGLYVGVPAKLTKVLDTNDSI